MTLAEPGVHGRPAAGRAAAAPPRARRAAPRWSAPRRCWTRSASPSRSAASTAYPHELSGGQQQRVMIAMALACEPKLLIADEPTTALDVTIQRQILELIAKLQERHRMSVLFISHDLGVVGEIADHVVVMRHGIVREQGPVARIFQRRRTPTPRRCWPAGPAWANPARADGDRRPHRRQRAARGRPSRRTRTRRWCSRCARWPRASSCAKGLFGKREFKAVQDVNFKLRKGHTLGVVGESGSGKTTMGLTLLRLHEPTAGEVMFDGRNLLTLSDRERQAMRRRIQIVFQNPYASLNPRFTIGQTLIEPMAIHGIGDDQGEREQRARTLLGKVGPRRLGVRQVPARVLRRPAPAHRDRALPDAGPRGAGARRGGERARRLGAGAGAEPAEGPAGRVRPGLRLHQPRPRRWCASSATRCW